MVNKLALFITHNIFLTNDQIEDLIKNNFLETVGVSVPVWINARNSRTTEPASELFLNYELIKSDNRSDNDIEIINKKGYRVYICESNWKPMKQMSLEKLAGMSNKSRENYEKKINTWWEKNPKPPCLEDLRTAKYFRTKIKKLDQKFDKIKCVADIQHTLEIKTIDNLINSLC